MSVAVARAGAELPTRGWLRLHLGGSRGPCFRVWEMLDGLRSVQETGIAHITVAGLARRSADVDHERLSPCAVTDALARLRAMGVVGTARKRFRTVMTGGSRRSVRVPERAVFVRSADEERVAGPEEVLRMVEKATRRGGKRAGAGRPKAGDCTKSNPPVTPRKYADTGEPGHTPLESNPPTDQISLSSEISDQLRIPSGASPAAASFSPPERAGRPSNVPRVTVPPIPRLPDRCTDAELVEAAMLGANAALRKVYGSAAIPYTVPVKRSVRAHKKNPRPGSWVCDPLPRSARRASKTGDAFELVLEWAKLARDAGVRPASWCRHVFEQWKARIGKNPTARLPLKSVFGPERFRKELGWFRSGYGSELAQMVHAPITRSGKLAYEKHLWGRLTPELLSQLMESAAEEARVESANLIERAARGEWIWGM